VAQQARRRWREDRCTQAASSLAFQTALALVPLLAVAFALLKATGQLEAGSHMPTGTPSGRRSSGARS
jgi:uncharacterized BrkB/YihY/UPF0761 family membrane protein